MAVMHHLQPSKSDPAISWPKNLPMPLAIAGLIAAAFVAFIGVVMILGAIWLFGSDGGKSAIETVLRQDKTLEVQLESQVHSGTSAIDAARTYIREIDQIDLRQCPDDFAQAYVRHRAAWRALVAQVDSEPDSWLGQVIAGGMNLLGGEVDGGASRIRRENLAAEEAVRDSWTDVEAAAARHHALLPSAP